MTTHQNTQHKTNQTNQQIDPRFAPFKDYYANAMVLAGYLSQLPFVQATIQNLDCWSIPKRHATSLHKGITETEQDQFDQQDRDLGEHYANHYLKMCYDQPQAMRIPGSLCMIINDMADTKLDPAQVGFINRLQAALVDYAQDYENITNVEHRLSEKRETELKRDDQLVQDRDDNDFLLTEEWGEGGIIYLLAYEVDTKNDDLIHHEIGCIKYDYHSGWQCIGFDKYRLTNDHMTTIENASVLHRTIDLKDAVDWLWIKRKELNAAARI